MASSSPTKQYILYILTGNTSSIPPLDDKAANTYQRQNEKARRVRGQASVTALEGGSRIAAANRASAVQANSRSD
jgi:hypothetical protein